MKKIGFTSVFTTVILTAFSLVSFGFNSLTVDEPKCDVTIHINGIEGKFIPIEIIHNAEKLNMTKPASCEEEDIKINDFEITIKTIEGYRYYSNSGSKFDKKVKKVLKTLKHGDRIWIENARLSVGKAPYTTLKLTYTIQDATMDAAIAKEDKREEAPMISGPTPQTTNESSDDSEMAEESENGSDEKTGFLANLKQKREAKRKARKEKREIRKLERQAKRELRKAESQARREERKLEKENSSDEEVVTTEETEAEEEVIIVAENEEIEEETSETPNMEVEPVHSESSTSESEEVVEEPKKKKKFNLFKRKVRKEEPIIEEEPIVEEAPVEETVPAEELASDKSLDSDISNTPLADEAKPQDEVMEPTIVEEEVMVERLPLERFIKTRYADRFEVRAEDCDTITDGLVQISLFNCINCDGKILVDYYYDIDSAFVRDYDKRGRITERYHVKNNKLHGPYVKYFTNGHPENVANYKEGAKYGSYRNYYRSGYIKVEGQYGMKNNRLNPDEAYKDGKWIYFYRNGQVRGVEYFEEGAKLKSIPENGQ